MLPTTLLIFDQWGDVHAFSSLEVAETAAEMFDFDEGEHAGAFTPDGRVVTIAAAAGRPGFITVTDAVDQPELARLLEAAAFQRGRSWPTNDPSDIAALLLHEIWEQRWPRRPRWLSRRLHGEEPQIPRSAQAG